jgi:Holliday junction resolvase RusA-like endonuclease
MRSKARVSQFSAYTKPLESRRPEKGVNGQIEWPSTEVLRKNGGHPSSRPNSESAADLSGILAEFRVPRPPTTNRLFFNAPGKGRTKTSKYRKWRFDSAWMLKLQNVPRVSGPVSIDVRVPDLPGRAPDLDNIVKALIDLLVNQRVIEEDDKKIVRELHMRWERGIQEVNVVLKRADA